MRKAIPLMLISFLGFTSCNRADPATQETIYVAQNTAPCAYPSQEACLLIKSNLSDPWKTSAYTTQAIQGFTYQTGNRYNLTIVQESRFISIFATEFVPRLVKINEQVPDTTLAVAGQP